MSEMTNEEFSKWLDEIHHRITPEDISAAEKFISSPNFLKDIAEHDSAMKECYGRLNFK